MVVRSESPLGVHSPAFTPMASPCLDSPSVSACPTPFGVTVEPALSPAWEIARTYLRREYFHEPEAFIPKLVNVLRREHIRFPTTDHECLQQVVIDAAEPTPWERQFLCAMASAWVTEHDLARSA